MESKGLLSAITSIKSSKSVSVLNSINSASKWVQNSTMVKHCPKWSKTRPVLINGTKFACPYCYALGEVAYISSHYCFTENNNACPACANNANSAHINSAGCYQSFTAMRSMDFTENSVKYGESESSFLASLNERRQAYIEIRNSLYDAVVYINNVITSEEKSYNNKGYHGICHWLNNIVKVFILTNFVVPCTCLYTAQRAYYGLSVEDIIAYFCVKYSIDIKGTNTECLFCKKGSVQILTEAPKLYFYIMIHVLFMQSSSKNRSHFRDAMLKKVAECDFNKIVIGKNAVEAFDKMLQSVTASIGDMDSTF